jgi:hypothetical protein
MDKINSEGGRAYSKHLGLFYSEPTDVGIESYHFMDYPSMSSEDGDIIEFNIPNTSGNYLDLRKTRLILKCQLLKSDSSNIPDSTMKMRTVEGEEIPYEDIPDDARVCVSSLFIASVFRQCQVTLNNITFSPYVSTNYAYKGFLDTIWFSSESERKTELRNGLWIKDDYESAQDSDPFTTSNTGLFQRHAYVRGSKKFTMSGRIYSDLFEIPKFLLSNIELCIKFWKNDPSFCLISSNTNSPSYKVKIHDAKISLCFVHPSPSLLLAQAKLLSTHDAIYNYKSSIIKTVSLATGDRSHVVNNCFSGDIPNFLIVGLISTESYMGNYSRNPWVFLPYSLSFIGYSIDGTYVPHGPLQPKFVKDKYQDSDFAQTYSTLFSGMYKPDISPEEFVECLNLYSFEVTRVRRGTKSIQKRGFSRLSLEFNKPLPAPTTLMMYGRFSSAFKVTESRNIRML